MSNAFMKVLESYPDQSYLQLLQNVNATLRSWGYMQEPQFSCSYEMGMFQTLIPRISWTVLAPQPVKVFSIYLQC